MTNYEKIKSFTEEELAEFLEDVVSGNRATIGIKCGKEKCENWKCTECISTWLNQQI